MPAKTGIVKPTTVKSYITTAKKMRSQASAVKKFIDDFDVVIEAVIVEAVRLATAAKRTHDALRLIERHRASRVRPKTIPTMAFIV